MHFVENMPSRRLHTTPGGQHTIIKNNYSVSDQFPSCGSASEAGVLLVYTDNLLLLSVLFPQWWMGQPQSKPSKSVKDGVGQSSKTLHVSFPAGNSCLPSFFCLCLSVSLYVCGKMCAFV